MSNQETKRDVILSEITKRSSDWKLIDNAMTAGTLHRETSMQLRFPEKADSERQELCVEY